MFLEVYFRLSGPLRVDTDEDVIVGHGETDSRIFRLTEYLCLSKSSSSRLYCLHIYSLIFILNTLN